MQKTSGYRFGFDIGGTFTDLVLAHTATGHIETHKLLTTPHDLAQAVLDGLTTLLERVGATGADVDLAIHGTTLITNALIERKGARTALITTRGHRDVLEMAREMRYDIYDLLLVNPEPLVPRPLRLEISERLDGRGQVVRPVDPNELAELSEILTQQQVEAVAVCLLHAYRNPTHEQQVATWLQQTFPELAVSLSSQVAPEIREYERMATTVANAYVQPRATRYLADLQQRLTEHGYARPLYLMLSSGGIAVAQTAARFPIRLVESGPAAGALAASFYGQLTGQNDLIAFDMGGTTAKICVITDGQPQLTNTFEIARMHRFKRGSGLPVRIPAIELIEIGAGGGSIARQDELGLLKVGPHSAGADPGPACYGRGGTQPTVTDADLLLGYLNPAFFLGGRLTLDRDAAEATIGQLGAVFGLSVTAMAAGIYRVVNEAMQTALRVHVAERGVDPRGLRLVAFGGAGPVHADALARALKLRGYLIPTHAGVASALGFLTAPMAFDLAQTQIVTLTEGTLTQTDAVFAHLMDEGRTILTEAGVAPEAMQFICSADLRHAGQGHEITVALPAGRLQDLGLERIREVFFAQYTTVYGYAHRHLDLELMACRVRATGGTPPVQLAQAAPDGTTAEQARKGSRPAYLPAVQDFVELPVYDRYQLQSGMHLRGPAIIEEPDSTTVIGPDASATVDAYLNILVEFD